MVCDLLFNCEQTLVGISLERGGWLRSKRFIPASCIKSVEIQKIKVTCEERLPKIEPPMGWTGVVTGESPLRGRQMVDAQGNYFGEVSNVYFLEDMGTLIGYELSDGWWNDLKRGRKVIQPWKPLIWKKETILVPYEHHQLFDG